jgi:hypothetical protein
VSEDTKFIAVKVAFEQTWTLHPPRVKRGGANPQSEFANERWGRPASLRFDLGFIDKHYRDVILDGVDAPALAALEPLTV